MADLSERLRDMIPGLASGYPYGRKLVDDIQLAAAICKAAEEWDGLHITKTEFENYFYAVAALRAAVAAGKETP